MQERQRTPQEFNFIKSKRDFYEAELKKHCHCRPSDAVNESRLIQCWCCQVLSTSITITTK